MKYSTKLQLFLLIPLAAVSTAHGALVITPSDNGANLASSILGPGITLVPGSVVYSGATIGASGTFTGGASAGITLESGLILTTGLANSAPGPNNATNTSGAGTTSTLRFSFESPGGNLFFNYVFASEEYNEYVNSQFNDKFKFNLDGVNIALLPGSSTPVEINTVNLGSNSSLYNNNAGGAFNIEYDGFTDVLTAQALGLSAGVHTIELTISDVGDAAWDSAVFIQGNSFSGNPTPPTGVPDGGTTMVLFGSALLGLAGIKRKLR